MIFKMTCMYLPRFHIFKVNLHCKEWRDCKLDLSLVFKGRVFGKCLGLDSVIIRVEFPSLNSNSFIRRVRETRRHTMCTGSVSWQLILPCAALGLWGWWSSLGPVPSLLPSRTLDQDKWSHNLSSMWILKTKYIIIEKCQFEGK